MFIYRNGNCHSIIEYYADQWQRVVAYAYNLHCPYDTLTKNWAAGVVDVLVFET
uniref:Uncharacterized protein n=1 Tax=Anguilla anguilla TaxID=7936 RepID=A0A0E9SSE1_ANGAN